MNLSTPDAQFRVGAVGYLNPVPLVWGMLHGPQKEFVNLSFSPPAECARQIEAGEVQIGLAPVAEIARQGLQMVRGVGISCLGSVRSILLFTRVPWKQVRTLAADTYSRTSVQLARVILRERFGVEPDVTAFTPDLPAMMNQADAALLIGDAALRVEPAETPYEWLDLGEEWLKLTKLPMVFAMWAGKGPLPLQKLRELTRGSYDFGRDHLDDIIESEYAKRGITRELTADYLRRNIRFEIGEAEQQGLETFFELAGLTEGAKL